MRFMVVVPGSPESEAGELPSTEPVEASRALECSVRTEVAGSERHGGWHRARNRARALQR